MTAYDDETKIDMGIATPESGQAALKALDRAMSDYRDNAYDVLVTAPLNKSNIQGEGFDFKGNASYIETSLGDGNKAMTMLVSKVMRISFVTNDIALKDVASAITKENVAEKAQALFNTIRRDFNISNPRIAILALNPKSDGNFGKEEKEIITPVIDEILEKGVEAFGPYAADEFFGNGYYEYFDGILAMYHDQGMAPFKAVSPDNGVVYTAGLPVICAEADVDVNYENAGKNTEDETSFRNSIYLAIDAFRSRTNYDEARVDPLKKLYHEKRDESEKVRFAIPKKHSNAPFPPQPKSENRNDRQQQQENKPQQLKSEPQQAEQ